MLCFGKAKKIGINCRCGKRTVWKLPEDVKKAIDTNTPLSLERREEGCHTILPIGVAYFACRCGRIFEYSVEGIRNITERTDCQDVMKIYSPSKMVN